MRKILIKEIDIKFDGENIVREYLIYYIVNNEKLNAYIELGEYNKDKRVEFLKAIKGDDIIVENMTYEKYIKQ